MHDRAVSMIAAGCFAVLLLPGCTVGPRSVVGCDPPVPINASPAAREYADAAHDALRARRDLSDTIADQQMMMSRDDMATSATIDAEFLAVIQEIDFPVEAEASAEEFIDAVAADSAFLFEAAAADDGYYGAHAEERELLHAERTRTGAHLRDVLGLPPTSCRLNLP